MAHDCTKHRAQMCTCSLHPPETRQVLHVRHWERYYSVFLQHCKRYFLGLFFFMVVHCTKTTYLVPFLLVKPTVAIPDLILHLILGIRQRNDNHRHCWHWTTLWRSETTRTTQFGSKLVKLGGWRGIRWHPTGDEADIKWDLRLFHF